LRVSHVAHGKKSVGGDRPLMGLSPLGMKPARKNVLATGKGELGEPGWAGAKMARSTEQRCYLQGKRGRSGKEVISMKIC